VAACALLAGLNASFSNIDAYPTGVIARLLSCREEEASAVSAAAGHEVRGGAVVFARRRAPPTAAAAAAVAGVPFGTVGALAAHVDDPVARMRVVCEDVFS
jgi:hypothetical protein